MPKCVFSDGACEVCGLPAPPDAIPPIYRTCGPSPQPGLGDYTEQLLSSIGVTKDRYSAAKELFGLAPTCNCETRKEWLNKVGAWLGL